MIAEFLTFLVRIITGVQARWLGCGPDVKPRVYFANHTSNLDFVVLWAALPAEVRRLARPAAAHDYWTQGVARRFVAERVFRAVLIERKKVTRETNPLPRLVEALKVGESVIIFPEGRRNTDTELLPFKSGIYHLAREIQELEFVPVYIENLNRVLPRGEVLPIPLLCSVSFGAPIRLLTGESRDAFMARAKQGIESMMAG